MVRIVFAFLIMVAGAATLGTLQAFYEWPRLLALLALAPVVLAGTFVLLPLLVRRPPRGPVA